MKFQWILKNLNKYYEHKHVPFKNMQIYYINLIYMKEYKNYNIIDKIKNYNDIGRLNNEYKEYINKIKEQDYINNNNINNVMKLKEDTNILNVYDNKNKYNNKRKVIKLFNKVDMYNKGEQGKIKKYILQNVLEDHINDLNNRKINNNLIKPYYFFTANYNEKSMPSQIRHWYSSIYSYLKEEKISNNYLDMYTNRLIRLFFTVKYIKRRLIWDVKLIQGFKIVPSLSMLEAINTIINYTSNRSSLNIRKVIKYAPTFLTLEWVKEQLNWSITMSRRIKQRKLNFYTGHNPKRKSYIRKLSRVLLGKPLFKHTSLNLIIDLFVYNNKRYKFKRIKNIILRRSIYKYMYSMYINYQQKIKETINRPRFFYINLIEPKIYQSYSSIIKYYDYYLIKNNKSIFIYLCFLALQLNFITKNKLNYLKNILFNSNNNENTKYTNINTPKKKKKGLLYSLSLKRNKDKLIYKNNKEMFNSIEYNNEENINKQEKNKEINKSKYYLLKKYLNELKIKSNTPIDLNSLNLWKTDGMGSSYRTPEGLVNLEEKNKIKKLKKKRFTRDSREIFFKDQAAYFEVKKGKERKKWIKNQIRIAKKYDIYSIEDIQIFELCNLNTPKDVRDTMRIEDFIKKKINYSKGIFYYDTDNDNNFKENININNNNNKIININDINNNNINNNNDNNNNDNNYNDNINNNNDNNNNNNNYNDNLNNNEINYKNSSEYSSQYIDINNTNNNNLSENNSNNILIYDNKNVINNEENKTLIDNLLSTFYLKNENIENIKKDSSINNKEDYNKNKEEDVNNKKNYYGYNYNKLFKLNKFDNKNDNSKNKYLLISSKINKNEKNNSSKNNIRILWDKLDYSILNILSRYIKNNYNKDKIKFSSFQWNYLFNEINKFKGYSKLWYILYFMSVIQKEYNKISRDLLLSKEDEFLSNIDNRFNNYSYINYDLLDKKIIHYNIDDKDKFKLQFWPLFYPNNREEELRKIKGYNEKLFKPYYRNMLFYFIMKSYIDILNYLGIINLSWHYKDILKKKLYNINIVNYNLYNFVLVKILLDLFHYNYRSLIKVKPRYYYINKLRYNLSKFRRLNLNNWVASIRFIKKLRKAHKNFWLRFHKVAIIYFNRITHYAELDVKRTILVPFVIYFEDILYTIYGKWVLIRLWPLKRYFLSSYILAGRVLLLLLWRKRRTNKKYNFQRITSKLIAGINILHIKKAYNYYVSKNSPWPNTLLKNIYNNNYSHKLFYNDLENFNKKEFKFSRLDSYLIANNSLYYYLSPLKYNYVSAFKDNINYISKNFIKYKIRSNKITNLQFMYYWLRPLKQNILKLSLNFDISGINFRLSGRAGTRRNNLRSIYKNRVYGSFLGPYHINPHTTKKITIPTPKLRGYMKSNIDYAYKISKSKNGAISLKIWISSVISTDLRELLLHIVKIKSLYSQLINRFYLVNPHFNYISNNYLIKSVNNSIVIPKYYKYSRSKFIVNVNKKLNFNNKFNSNK